MAKLIAAHEVGGTQEQNALMDADSVSFFETNAGYFVKVKALDDGPSSVRKKLDWMFSRIKSPIARAAAKARYEKWIYLLERDPLTRTDGHLSSEP